MKTKKLSALTLALAALCGVLFFQSCDKKTKAVTPAEIEGYWVLKAINGQEAKTAFKGALPTILLDFKDMKISGTGGCNRYTGGFSFENNTLKTTSVATTMMACLDENDEKRFLEFIENELTVSVENNDLTLKASGKEDVFVFEKAEAPVVLTVEQKLAGTWTLVSIDEKPVAEVFKGEGAKIPTLILDFENGKANGTAGCNNYMTTFTYDNGLLIVTPPRTTMMACPNLAGETQYVKNLSDTTGISFQEDGTKLDLRKKGKLVLEFKKGE